MTEGMVQVEEASVGACHNRSLQGSRSFRKQTNLNEYNHLLSSLGKAGLAVLRQNCHRRTAGPDQTREDKQDNT